MGSLDGRTALVTGASRGLGAAIAARLATAGASVAVSARTLDPDPRYSGTLRDTVSSIVRGGGTAVAFAADLSEDAERRQLVDRVIHALGRIDILVNNAAVTYLQPFETFPRNRFDLMLEIQLAAPFALTQLVVPPMYERGAGWILNISSRASEHPPGPPWEPLFDSGWTVYGACKAGLERFSTALAAEGYRRGLRVNTLAPQANVATPGAEAHDLVEDFELEDSSIMAEAALALVEGDLTGRVAISQRLLAELGRTAQPLPVDLAG